MTIKAPAMSSCCSARPYPEDIFYTPAQGVPGPVKQTFAQVAVCPRCRRAVGDPVLDRGKTELTAKFNSLSWTMMLECHPRPPYQFKKSSSGWLIPEDYKGDLKSQGDLF